MSDKTRNDLLREYSAAVPRYQDLANLAKLLLEQLLAERKLIVHSVTCRAKDSTSLTKKLGKPDREYGSLDEITDLAGVRVITYFESDVGPVSELIEKEFLIDRDNSIDKRRLLDPDRFGYLSVHYIATLTKARSRLTEYKRFAGIKFEIQVRSILQHAWAEIEHDLGYKSEFSLPRSMQRRFSRVAGLLELADAEFAAIREELAHYEDILPKLIKENPADVYIDQASMRIFILTDSTVETADRKLTSEISVSIERELPPQYLGGLVTRARYFGLSTIAELKTALSERQNMIPLLAKHWFGWSEGNLPAGISIFYLAYYLAAETGNPKTIRKYFDLRPVYGDPAQHTLDLIRAFESALTEYKRERRAKPARRSAQKEATSKKE